MTTTLTFRLEAALRRKLKARAALFGKTESEFLRDLLDRELEERPLGAALAKVKGALSLKGTKDDAWHKKLRKRNWRE